MSPKTTRNPPRSEARTLRPLGSAQTTTGRGLGTVAAVSFTPSASKRAKVVCGTRGWHKNAASRRISPPIFDGIVKQEVSSARRETMSRAHGTTRTSRSEKQGKEKHEHTSPFSAWFSMLSTVSSMSLKRCRITTILHEEKPDKIRQIRIQKQLMQFLCTKKFEARKSILTFRRRGEIIF